MDDKVPLDTSDVQQVKARAKAAELQRQREMEELRVLLDTVGGRAFIWRLLGYCNLYKPSPFDAQASARFEGRRDIGIWVRDELLTSDARAYNLMRSEAKRREEEE